MKDTKDVDNILRVIKAVKVSKVVLGAVAASVFLTAVSHGANDILALGSFAGVYSFLEIIQIQITSDCERKLFNRTFQKVYTRYRLIVKEIARLAREMNMNNPVEVFYLIDMLKNNGYLHYDGYIDEDFHRYKYEYNYLAGFMALNNHGVCRHLSALLSDVLKELGFESYLLVGYVDNMSDPCPYKKNLSERITPSARTSGNHQITVGIDENDTVYYLDLMNTSYYIKKKKNRNVITDDLGFKMEIREKSTNDLNGCDVLKVIGARKCVSPKKIKELLISAGDKFFDNLDLLGDFKDRNRDRLLIIDNEYWNLVRK